MGLKDIIRNTTKGLILIASLGISACGGLERHDRPLDEYDSDIPAYDSDNIDNDSPRCSVCPTTEIGLTDIGLIYAGIDMLGNTPGLESVQLFENGELIDTIDDECQYICGKPIRVSNHDGDYIYHAACTDYDGATTVSDIVIIRFEDGYANVLQTCWQLLDE